jgi:predicted RNA methylase
MCKDFIDRLFAQVLENPPYSWFPSSKSITKQIIARANIQSGHRCLDVCAGDGRLAIAAFKTGAIVDVIEINPIFQQILFQRGFRLVGEDFMQTQPQQLYPRIISNPPFSFSPEKRGVDLAIIRRAFNLFLAPGGRLVSIVSASHRHTRCPKAQAFRNWLNTVRAELIELPLESFWGTERPVTVESWLLIADKK